MYVSKYIVNSNSVVVVAAATDHVDIIDHSLGSEIGSGEFGSVFQGVWFNGKQEIQVAVKTLYSQPFDDTRIRLMKEAAMVDQFLHNNIVRLHGVVLKGNPVSAILV